MAALESTCLAKMLKNESTFSGLTSPSKINKFGEKPIAPVELRTVVSSVPFISIAIRQTDQRIAVQCNFITNILKGLSGISF